MYLIGSGYSCELIIAQSYHLTLAPLSHSVKQVTQGVGHGCHESIDDANYDGDLATYMRK
jgi:hypothetical protein